MKRILHLMHADKFTLPLIDKLNLWFDEEKHVFLLVGVNDENIEKFEKHKSIRILKSPLRKNLLHNAKLVYHSFVNADLIILHGLPVIFYFLFFRKAINKLAWIIYGGTDLYLYPNEGISIRERLINENRKYVLKKVRYHISHIEGDSKIANELYNSKAKFLYSQVYLSNVIQKKDFVKSELLKKDVLNILVGHSTDTSNNHIEIFSWLSKLANQNFIVYCPLSYGSYDQYKAKVIASGKELFGDKFIPVEGFMPFEEYRNWLKQIDIAIFNHKRQEAMGVTLTLLSMGKVVYMNPNTSSYKSFVDRGILVYNNELLANPNELYTERMVEGNQTKLIEYYSEEMLRQSWSIIYSV